MQETWGQSRHLLHYLPSGETFTNKFLHSGEGGWGKSTAKESNNPEQRRVQISVNNFPYAYTTRMGIVSSVGDWQTRIVFINWGVDNSNFSSVESLKNRSLRGHVLTGNECYTINIVYVIVDMLL